MSRTSASVGSVALPPSREIRSAKNPVEVFRWFRIRRGASSRPSGFWTLILVWLSWTEARRHNYPRGTTPQLSHETAASDPPFSFPPRGRRGGDGSLVLARAYRTKKVGTRRTRSKIDRLDAALCWQDFLRWHWDELKEIMPVRGQHLGSLATQPLDLVLRQPSEEYRLKCGVPGELLAKEG